MKYKESYIKLRELRKKLYIKYLKKKNDCIFDNEEIVFDCLICKKEVRAFIDSSLGYTLLCKDCFNEKYNEYLKSKHMSFVISIKRLEKHGLNILKI